MYVRLDQTSEKIKCDNDKKMNNFKGKRELVIKVAKRYKILKVKLH